MTNKQHKDYDTNENVEPNEGERTLLCCNKTGIRSPSLDFSKQHEINDDTTLLDQLSDILVAIFLEQEDAKHHQKGSDLLPGVNQRAS